MPRALDVLFPLPVPPLRYLAPHAPADDPGAAPADGAAIGWRVVVPWQGGVRTGLVVGESDASAGRSLELREAIGWLGDEPHLDPRLAADLPALGHDLAAPPGVAMGHLVATGFNDPLEHEVRAVHGDALAAPVPGLEALGAAWAPAERYPAAALDLARRQGLLDERVRVVPDTVGVLAFVRPADADLEGAPRAAQRRALERLERDGPLDSAAELARRAEVSASAARALVAKGYAEYRDVPRDYRPPEPHQEPRWTEVQLPEDDPLPSPTADTPVALFGGRRADRLAATVPRLRAELAAGRSPLLLVPEQVQLDEAIAALGRHLPGAPQVAIRGDDDDAQRRAAWARLQRGGPALVIGTYLALYAPRRDPGTTVVLEAGAGAYKLPAGPRPFVPDLALRLARRLDCAAVTADAMLSPDAARRSPAEARRALPHPRVRLHASDLASTHGWPLGADLVKTLRQVEARGRQAVLLAPRRGFSAALGCPDCGWVAPCPNCDLPLRYHREGVPLRCHQCGYRTRPPALCPTCESTELGAQRGAGTEWIADAVRRVVTDLPVLRFDGDRRDDLSGALGGEACVVVGTTALLRHPPLPAVSLVGLTFLDGFLNLGDFRAEEGAARLLLDLPELWSPGGRVPLVVVQTFRSDSAVLGVLRAEEPGAAAERLAESMLERRRRFGYPPARELASVQVSARERGAAQRVAGEIAARLRVAVASDDEVLGPAPAPVARVRGRYGYHLLVRSDDAQRFRRLLETVGDPSGARVRIDVAPREIGGLLD